MVENIEFPSFRTVDIADLRYVGQWLKPNSPIGPRLLVTADGITRATAAKPKIQLFFPKRPNPYNNYPLITLP
jgi:hypothetical protein